MITKIEIDGFKTFENFELDLRSFSAVVGPNASGKSNLFDALRFLSSLAQFDIRTAMQKLRGEPEELFRQSAFGSARVMKFALEVLLERNGADAFGTKYEITGQRLRYELGLELRLDDHLAPRGIYVVHEICEPLSKSSDYFALSVDTNISYTRRKTPFISMRNEAEADYAAFEIRQDGPAGEVTKRGRPVTLPAAEATRTALSTITTAEFPHLYALRDMLANIRFLEINPHAARQPSDRFELRTLKPDASNLAAVLAHLQQETSSSARPDGVISDISVDLSYLIPGVANVNVIDSPLSKEYSFGVRTTNGMIFSSRVISDGTLRLLALLAVLDDPNRRGILCFEEPENGVHEGRIPALMNLLRQSSSYGPEENGPLFQILVNTHSPAVMSELQDDELIAADMVTYIVPSLKASDTKTRMRTAVRNGEEEYDPERALTRAELVRLLKRQSAQV